MVDPTKEKGEREGDIIYYPDSKWANDLMRGRIYYDPNDTARINSREFLRIENDFPPKTSHTFDLLIEEAVEKGNSHVKSTYYLDQTERVLVQVYYKKIIKADRIFFRHVRVKTVFANLWKTQVEIEVSNLSPRWKNLLIKLAEMRKFQVALHETDLVPKKFHWIPTRR